MRPISFGNRQNRNTGSSLRNRPLYLLLSGFARGQALGCHAVASYRANRMQKLGMQKHCRDMVLSLKPKAFTEKNSNDRHEDKREQQKWATSPSPSICSNRKSHVKKLSGLSSTCCSSAVSSPIFMIDPSFESSLCTLSIKRRHALATLPVFTCESVQDDEVIPTRAGSVNKPSRDVK